MRTHKILFLIFLLAFALVNSHAQDLTDDIKTFTTLNVNYKLSDKTRASISYTGISDLAQAKTNYHQIGLTHRYKITPKSYISSNLDFIKINQRSENTFKNYTRVGFEYSRNSSWRRFLIGNDLGGEVFFPKFSKYQYRYIYSLDITYRLNFTKWKIRPYSNMKVYYYSGGDLINYYDNESNLMAIKAPNDIHRWRWYLGFKMKPSKNLSLIVSYLHNEEFNAGINRYSDINIYNRKKNGIKLPFNSYDGINLLLSYTLKFKTKGDDSTED